ncbi:MAG TPA: amino acid adenylation domain-containing protein [Candidatus Dormibacteraeota bacterium]|nr:amino acid adenylation domain-containing protein [Candidatus Dormibacteraeota bacterium]
MNQDGTTLALTSSQCGILFHTLREPGSGIYVEQLSCFMEGNVDVDAFRQAWQYLVDRHDALRTGFEQPSSGEPRQRIHPTARFSVDVLDWRHRQNEGVNEALSRLAVEERKRPFNLTDQPLMRVALIQLGPGKYTLLWTHHHLILDGWSVGLLVQDLTAIYLALRDGRRPNLPSAYSFAPYVRWLARQPLGETTEYWRNYLEGFREATILAKDNGAAGEVSPDQASSLTWTLDPSEEQALRKLTCSAGCSSFTAIAAAWGITLAMEADQRDVIFGVTTSGRPCSLPGAESMVGLFINTIPLRIRIDPGEGTRAWLRRMEDQKQLLVDRHSYAPLPEILKLTTHSAGKADALFNTLLVYENYPLPSSFEISPDLVLRDIRCTDHTNYDVTLIVVPSPHYEFVLTFAAGYRKTAVHLLARLRKTLARICELSLASGGVVKALFEISEVDRRLVLREFARGGEAHVATNAASGVPARIERLIWERMERRGTESIAVSDGQVQWTYGYLRTQVRNLARKLAAIGVQREDRVGLCLRRSPWLLAGALAILEAGGCYVPLDPDWPAERKRWIAADAGLRAVLLDEGSTPLSWGASWPLELFVGAGTSDGESVDLPGEVTEFHRGDSDIAYVIYTSGSTGTPKGVMVEHAGAVNRLLWMQKAYPLAAGDRVLQKTPASFDVSVWELFWPLMVGARVVMAEPGGHRDPRYLSREMRCRRIGTLHFVPSMLNAFLEDQGLEASAGQTRCLERVICSGEALTGELAQRFWAGAEAAGFAWKKGSEGLFNLYGPTEASVDVSSWACERGKDTEAARLSVPIGRPIDGIQLYVLGPGLEPVPPGAKGELCIGGIGVARGYLGRPSLTAGHFVPDPFGGQAGKRLYCTGDRARWRIDGSLEYLGRMDQQVKIRGVRVEPDEIASTLRTHPGIRQAVVIALIRGDGSTHLAAYVVRRDRTEAWGIARNRLRAWLEERLPEPLIPAVFVDMQTALPISENGKLDRRALPSIDKLFVEDSAAGARRLSVVEQTVAEIWTDVLGLPPQTPLGSDDHFFRIGGDSLSSLKAAARLSACFGVDFSVANIWTFPTIQGAAEQIEHLKRVSGSETALTLIPRLDPAKPALLSHAQQRLWIVHQQDPSGVLHNVSCAVWMDGHLNEAALRTALSGLLARHETLRSEFFQQGGVPWQRIRDGAQLNLNVIDVSAQPAEACVAYAREQMQTPFDLRSAPLARATLLHRGSESHAFVLTLHHIACDGTSAEILLRELRAMYDAANRGESFSLEPLRIRYIDYAAWQEQTMSTAAAQSSFEYWRKRLFGAPTDHGLHGSGSGQASSATAKRRLSPELTERLRRLKRTHSVTTFMLVLTGLKTLLHDLSGRTDVVVGTDISDRSHPDAWNVVGFFVNQLVLRTGLDGDPAYSLLIERVRATCVEAYAHRSVPYELLVKELRPGANRARSLFQVKLVQQQPLSLSFELDGLHIQPMTLVEPAAEFDLIFNLAEDAEAISLNVEFRCDRFTAEAIQVMLDRLERILTVSADAPTLPLSGVIARARESLDRGKIRLPGRRRVSGAAVVS